MLAAFGGRLVAALALPEAAGRYGGEEFLVILPGSEEAVVQRVTAIHSALTDVPYRFSEQEQIVTSSGGLAFLRENDTALTLIARADAALYKAKARGRNRIEQARSEIDAPVSDVDSAEAPRHGSGQDPLHDQPTSEQMPRQLE